MLTLLLNSYVHIHRLPVRYSPLADNVGSSNEPKNENLRDLTT